MIQDVVPLLASSNLNKLSQEKWCALGNGSQFCNVLRLAFQAVDLDKRWDKISGLSDVAQTLRDFHKNRTKLYQY